MRRRQFIVGVGSAAAVISFSARAQQPLQPPRIAVLTGAGSTDTEATQAPFFDGMKELGWIEGRNVHFDVRHGRGDTATIERNVADVVALPANVIVTSGTVTMRPLLRATRTIPIVFVNVADPVGAAFINSLSRPGGNATGFIQFEYSLSGKWVELLKQIAPNMTRAAVLRDAAITAGIGQFAVIQAVAPSAGVDVSPINVHDPAEIERAIAAFAQDGGGGLIVTGSALSAFHRDRIVAAAARHKLPAIYYSRRHVAAGGLMSYGSNIADQFRRAAGYVDRILKGEKPADLPVQTPTKYELVINQKTANALGISIPPTLLARADEVIE